MNTIKQTFYFQCHWGKHTQPWNEKLPVTEIQGAKTPLQSVESQRRDSPSEGFYQRGGIETQECFHFQHLLDKVCKIFHRVCEALMKESIMSIFRLVGGVAEMKEELGDGGLNSTSKN